MSKKKHRQSETAARRRRRPGVLAAPSIAFVVVALVGVAAVAFLLLPRGTAPAAQALPSEVDVGRAYQMYQSGALMLDVRTQAEWDEAHIAASVLIPLDELPDRLGEVPRDRDIVVICRSGNRSKEGTAILRDAGFERATCMTGGLREWLAAGYALEE
jgi:rhodanese-related sulfurtransferase